MLAATFVLIVIVLHKMKERENIHGDKVGPATWCERSHVNKPILKEEVFFNRATIENNNNKNKNKNKIVHTYCLLFFVVYKYYRNRASVWQWWVDKTRAAMYTRRILQGS